MLTMIWAMTAYLTSKRSLKLRTAAGMCFRKTSFVQFALVLVWGILIGIGLYQVQRFDNTPSLNSLAPFNYPSEHHGLSNQHGATLLVFVHPYCSCSNATIEELERVVAKSGNQLQASVIFWHPQETNKNWHESPLWHRAHSIPGVRVINDEGCTLTRQFGARTSGQTLFYNAAGELQFAGGITKARGHAGDNPGCDSILSLVRANSTPSGKILNCCTVFGCPLLDRQSIAIPQEISR